LEQKRPSQRHSKPREGKEREEERWKERGGVSRSFGDKGRHPIRTKARCDGVTKWQKGEEGDDSNQEEGKRTKETKEGHSLSGVSCRFLLA
jgi:hypothetical protein